MYGDRKDELPAMFVLAPCLSGYPIEEVVDSQQRMAQATLVHGSTVELPIEMRGRRETSAEIRVLLEQLGMRIIGPSSRPLLQQVELPAGWSLVPEPQHALTSWLLDGQGRRRGQMYYLAQFWDPAAHLTLLTRFTIEFDQERGRQNIVLVDIKDCDRVIHTINAGTFTTSDESHDAHGPAREQAEAWLTERYPVWQRVGSYWD